MSAKDDMFKKAHAMQKDIAEVKQVKEQALTKVMKNEALAKLYRDNASVGAENLQGELPQLKIHAAGRSQKNELPDGTEPIDGYFYYRPTKEQFKELDCHILTISKGYRADGFEGKKDVFNQVLAGVITNGGQMKPFIMYFTGIKLNNLWELGKEIAPFTRSSQLPIPMFALRVKMTTEKVKHNYGSSWVPVMKVQKYEDGSPELVLDEKVFEYLRGQVDKVADTIAALISSKSTEDFNRGVEVVPNPEDIPFT